MHIERDEVAASAPASLQLVVAHSYSLQLESSISNSPCIVGDCFVPRNDARREYALLPPSVEQLRAKSGKTMVALRVMAGHSRFLQKGKGEARSDSRVKI
nr:hypothetical protein [Mucilaginibacter sp. X5P1]